MHSRLISILTAIEHSLVADDPSPDDGSWDSVRTVNYSSGIARLRLSVRDTSGALKPRGAILLQGFRLADESTCLKATLTWQGTETNVIRSVYEKPGTDWTYEARRITAEWAGGPPPAQEPLTDTSHVASVVRAVAVG